jgi:hypothetical protein
LALVSREDAYRKQEDKVSKTKSRHMGFHILK